MFCGGGRPLTCDSCLKKCFKWKWCSDMNSRCMLWACLPGGCRSAPTETSESVVHQPLTLICMMMLCLTSDLSLVSPLWLLLTVQVWRRGLTGPAVGCLTRFLVDFLCFVFCLCVFYISSSPASAYSICFSSSVGRSVFKPLDCVIKAHRMLIIILLGSEINLELNQNETCDTYLTNSVVQREKSPPNQVYISG